MSTKPSDATTAAKKSLINGADSGSLRRAQKDVYEFAVAGDEHVNVRNTSYDETGHVYTVGFENGLPARCTCPADDHHDGPCKHRLAVLVRAPIMQAVNPTPVADGGQVLEAGEGDEDGDTPAYCFGEQCTGLDAEGMTCFGCHLSALEHYPEGSVAAPVPSSNGDEGG